MFTRKLLEISLFIVYWVGLAYFAIVHIYYLGLAKPYGWDKKPGVQWPSLAIFVFILLIIYLILRYLALMLYARCKISETILLAKTKQKIRLIKENSKKSSSLGGSTNLTYENEKQDLNNNKIKRFLSLNNITRPLRGTITKNGKSLDTVLDMEGKPRPGTSKSLEKLIDIYEKQNCDKNINNQRAKLNKYEIVTNGKSPFKHSKSAENLLDYNQIESAKQSLSVGNLASSAENVYDEIDGYSNLRKAPSAPPASQLEIHSAVTLPRSPKKVKRLAPTPPSSSTLPRLHQQPKVIGKPPLPPMKPTLLKNVLISNAQMFDNNIDSKNQNSVV